MSAGGHFSSTSLLPHLVGRSAGWHFSSDYILLDLVGRSASRHFSSASLLPHLVCRSAGWHFYSHLPVFFHIWWAGRHVGRLALLICQPSSTSGRQVGRLVLLFSSTSLLPHLVGRSACRQVGTSLLPVFFYIW